MEAIVFNLPRHLLTERGYPRLALLLSLLPSPMAAHWVFGGWPWSQEIWVLVVTTAFAHALAFWSAERMVRYPGHEVWGVAAFNLGFYMLLLVFAIAFGRLYFSRSFLLLSWILASLFLYMVLRFSPSMRLAFIPAGKAKLLQRLGMRPSESLSSLDGVEGVVVDWGDPEPRLLAWVKEATLRGFPVWHVTAVYERLTGRVLLDRETGLQEGLWAVVGVDRRPYMLFKRVWETALVLAFSPFLLLAILLVSLLVYLDLGRPVIFSQERVGLGGKVFRAYKFRTMRGAPRAGVYAGDEKDRITPLGRFLRRYRLDELPQFWNVLKGDMCLIGPRPEQRVLVEAYSSEIPLYCFRHIVRPGITGWAQVHHGYAEGKEGAWDKLSYDFFYIKYFSFWLDVRILVRTAWVVITGFGAK